LHHAEHSIQAAAKRTANADGGTYSFVATYELALAWKHTKASGL